MSKFEPFSPEPPSRVRYGDVLVRFARLEDAPFLAEITVERDGGSLAARCLRFEREIARAPTPDSVFSQGRLWVAEHWGSCLGFGRAAYFVGTDTGFDAATDTETDAAGTLLPTRMASSPVGWYLTGMIVESGHRRRGIGAALTEARLAWIRTQANEVFYFANAHNLTSIALHAQFGFEERTRDFRIPGVEFEGGRGILFVRRWT